MVVFFGELLCSFRSIPAHRLVLCLCSSYFEAMFGRSGFAESGEKEVLLEGEVIKKMFSNLLYRAIERETTFFGCFN